MIENNDRYVYLKNGDVISQLQRIAAGAGTPITSGPDAFIYDFLFEIGNSSIFTATRFNKSKSYHSNNISARMYKTDGVLFFKLLRRLYASLDLLIRLVLYRPTRILCGTAGGFLWVSFLVSRLYNIPIVFSCHNRIVGQRSGLLRKGYLADIWCIRRCDNVICHGPYLSQQLIDVGIPAENIIQFDVGFSDMNHSAGKPFDVRIPGVMENSKIVLYVGRIEEQKGVIDLLKACAEVMRKYPDVHTVYIGKGSALEELIKTAEDLAVTDKVRTLGYMNHEKIVDVMKHSMLVVTPTRIEFPEGRCMSAMEGLILGIPVVAPNFGPFPFLVQDNFNGLLYEPNSVSNLREKIMMVLEDSDLYKRLKAGARSTGEKLMKPELTFGEAVSRAFGQ